MADMFTSSTLSNCQRLPNGNTFICEGEWGRLFEVTPAGELCWEWVNNLPSSNLAPKGSAPQDIKPLMVTAAFRYEMDYPGLRRSSSATYERQKTPSTRQILSDGDPSKAEKGTPIGQEKKAADADAAERRLKQLGYF